MGVVTTVLWLGLIALGYLLAFHRFRALPTAALACALWSFGVSPSAMGRSYLWSVVGYGMLITVAALRDTAVLDAKARPLLLVPPIAVAASLCQLPSRASLLGYVPEVLAVSWTLVSVALLRRSARQAGTGGNGR